MAKSFDCPNCGGPLDYQEGGDPTIRCPFCNNSVIVPEELRSPRAAEAAPAQTPLPGPVSSTPATVADAALENLRALASQTTDPHELRRLARAERRILHQQERVERHRNRHGIG